MKTGTLLCLFTYVFSCSLSAQETSEQKQLTIVAPRAVLTSPTLDNRHRLGGGDRVIFRVLEDQEEPKTLVVGEAGELNVPYIGLVSAANKTCQELAQQIKAHLERDFYHRATVVLAVETVNKTRSLGKIYVGGQVKNGGVQEIPADEHYTLGKAILKAGGFSDFSDKKRVRVTRTSSGTKKTFVINVMEIWEKGDTEKDLVLQPEDSIYVPERLVNF